MINMATTHIYVVNSFKTNRLTAYHRLLKIARMFQCFSLVELDLFYGQMKIVVRRLDLYMGKFYHIRFHEICGWFGAQIGIFSQLKE